MTPHFISFSLFHPSPTPLFHLHTPPMRPTQPKKTKKTAQNTTIQTATPLLFGPPRPKKTTTLLFNPKPTDRRLTCRLPESNSEVRLQSAVPKAPVPNFTSCRSDRSRRTRFSGGVGGWWNSYRYSTYSEYIEIVCTLSFGIWTAVLIKKRDWQWGSCDVFCSLVWDYLKCNFYLRGFEWYMRNYNPYIFWLQTSYEIIWRSNVQSKLF